MAADAGTGKKLGPWTLGAELGRGGNATVYEATREELPGPVALKVINNPKAQREPYRRFVREIEFLQGLEDRSGVLPLLASNLPDKPSRENPPWLAMPIARSLKEALAEENLENVVAALAAIVGTLARLAHEGAAHRDIKPDNLYELNSEWLVGDFGLVALPDDGDETKSDRPLGPAYYRPYEMVTNPKDADPFPADVFALGKTLWVLATSQNYPPQGHQPAATRRFSIADMRPHQRSGLLDELVDRATRFDATQRPTMAEMAAELERWLELRKEAPTIDLSAEGARLRAQLAEELDAEDLLEQRKEFALVAVRRFTELFKPINEALKNVHPRAQVELMPDDYFRNYLSTMRAFGAASTVFKHIRMSQITTGPSHSVFALRIGRGIELTDEGVLILRVAIDVSHPRTSGTTYSWHSDDFVAPVGSIDSAQQMERLVEETQERLKEAVEAFSNHLASGD